VTVTPMTELEAVNAMLAAISESPVATLDDDTVLDAAQARTTLLNEMRAIQSKGWHWNSDYEYELTPNVSNNILIPATAAFVDPSKIAGKDYVWRGTRLYDRKNKTYVITEAVKCDIIWLLPFEEMPECFRRYVYIAAITKFVDQQMGDQAIHQYTEQDHLEARVEIERSEARTADRNVLGGSWSVARTLQRRSAWRG
jgi:hypothetical protein